MKSTSFKLPEVIHEQVKARVLQDGFGMRGKNAWFIKALESFLALPDYVDYVELADEPQDLSASVSIRLKEDVINKLEQAYKDVRAVFPLMEGIKSRIIRASIFQYLIQ